MAEKQKSPPMKRISLLVLIVLLSGCQLTANQPSDESQDFLAAESDHECDIAPDVADLIFTCEDDHDGTRPVIHPVTDLDSLMTSVAPVEEATPETDDLWQYVRQGLSMPVPDNRRVQSQLNWYLKHPTYMQRVNKRAAPFLAHIVAELEKADMPMEFALLPIVESAFDPFAYSHGRAAGMWQFIPGTGKRFGLKQNWWYDGRRDVMASTQAAIKYLQYLHKMFDGDWLHAVAAYNSGEGRVMRSIKRNKRQGKNTDFWSLDLPRETRAYVPKLLALSHILQNAEELEYNWPSMSMQPVTELVEVGSQIDLAMAADWAGLTLEQLHALNPGFNRWATDPDGPHQLLLPIDRVGQFTASLGDISDRQKLNWVRHKIKSGDSLLKLAKQYHTSVDVIKRVNELPGNRIIAGDHLMIPVAKQSLDSYSLSQDQRILATQNKRRGRYQIQHEVKSGDTFWDLSRTYKVNMRSLAKWNGMAPTDTLRPGQKLSIWLNKVNDKMTDKSVVRTVTYTVRNGDSLARIANKFSVRVKDLTTWNQLDAKKYLQPGQKLRIFVDVTET